MPEVFKSLKASLELSVIKGLASKFAANPRSMKRAIGVLVASVPISESAFRLFHLNIDPSSCSWNSSKVCGHRTAKPVWGNPCCQLCPSLFRYKIGTCVSLNRVVDVFRVLAACDGGEDGDVFSPFPQGWLTHAVAWKPVPDAVIDGVSLRAPNFPCSIKLESGTIIARR